MYRQLLKYNKGIKEAVNCKERKAKIPTKTSWLILFLCAFIFLGELL